MNSTAPISDSAELLLGRLVEKSQISIDLCKDMKSEISNLASDFRSSQAELRADIAKVREECAAVDRRVTEQEIRAKERREGWTLKQAVLVSLGTIFTMAGVAFTIYKSVAVAL